MRKRKFAAIVLVLVICFMSIGADRAVAQAALSEQVCYITLAPGETSERQNAHMTDQFNVYSNTNPSVAEPVFGMDPTGTYPFFVWFKAKSTGTTTIRIDGNHYRYRYEITVTDGNGH